MKHNALDIMESDSTSEKGEAWKSYSFVKHHLALSISGSERDVLALYTTGSNSMHRDGVLRKINIVSHLMYGTNT